MEVGTRMATRKRRVKKKELTIDQIKILLENALKGEKEVKILWKDLAKVYGREYTFQLLVDRLSLSFIKKIEDIPLVKTVHFFPKLGTGTHGINLLFKLHIIFEKL